MKPHKEPKWAVAVLAAALVVLPAGRMSGEEIAPERPPLVRSIERGDLAAVVELLKGGADPGVRTPEGITPLYAAAYSRQVKPQHTD